MLAVACIEVFSPGRFSPTLSFVVHHFHYRVWTSLTSRSELISVRSFTQMMGRRFKKNSVVVVRK
jgi:hypothetical protein